jgi:hypothetical protein
VRGGNTQIVAWLTSAVRLTRSHDEELAELTNDVNRLFEQHKAHSDGRELADGLFLARTQNEYERDADQVVEELGLQDAVTGESDPDGRLGLGIAAAAADRSPPTPGRPAVCIRPCTCMSTGIE